MQNEQVRHNLTLLHMKTLAESLAPLLRAGDVIHVTGDLGAGKTTFAQFLIQALSPVPVEVTSPTFTLLQTYPITLANNIDCEFYHYDLYRIEQESALIELGLEDALQGITFIEWPDRLGTCRLPVSLALSWTVQDDGMRTLTAYTEDARWRHWLA